MAEQLASVPEESNNDFTAPSPPCYSYRESFMSFAGPEWRIRSTLCSQSGQSGSNHSKISGAGASSSFLFNISGSASAGAAADFGVNKLNQGRPSTHKVSSSLSKQLVSVSEESTTVSTAPSPPSNSYRDSIRSVAWPEWRIISTLSSQSGQSGASYSGASSSYLSSNSSYSTGLGSAGPTDSRGELTKIAHRMVSDGYTQRMVQAFGDGGGQYRDLKNWFVELDVEWVLQIGVHKSRGHWGGSQQHIQLLLGNTSASWHRELIEKWVRAFTIIVASIKKEMVAAIHPETWAVARFGEASISPMLVFVEPILDVFKVVNLQPVLHMYSCVSNAAYDMSTLHTHSLISSETQSIFTKIGNLLKIKADNLINAISTTMNKVRMTLYDDNNAWAIDILRGGGEVHTNTRLMVDYILLMRKTNASTQNPTESQNTGELHGLIQCMIYDLNCMLLQKSELCSDPNLRHLFLLNNSYFVAQEVSEPSIPLDVELSSLHQPRLKLIPECEKYMDSYLDVSWGHVLYCILESNSLGQPKARKKTSSLAKFQSAFHQIYQVQKFWKVPDPQLRSLLRETITKGVITGYRYYLKEHPELEKQVSGGSNSPEVLEEMLGELFEG